MSAVIITPIGLRPRSTTFDSEGEGRYAALLMLVLSAVNGYSLGPGRPSSSATRLVTMQHNGHRTPPPDHETQPSNPWSGGQPKRQSVSKEVDDFLQEADEFLYNLQSGVIDAAPRCGPKKPKPCAEPRNRVITERAGPLLAASPAPYGHGRRDALPFRSNNRVAAWPLASFCHSPTALAPNTTPL